MKRYNRKKNIRWNTMKILVTGFLLVIVTGAVLLWLPVSNQKPIEFFDALFTSASAVCVTGLVTIIPQTQFTLFGKVILLILIQIGGLGIIACVTAFFFLLRRQISVRERMVIQETYNADSIGGIVGMVRRILIGTFTVEGVGALFYAVQFVPEYGLLRGIGYSIFHSVSAFCNAGIDILGSDSLAKYICNPLINITTMLLIILSGIGFSVWYDVLGNIKKIRKKEIPGKWWFTRLRLHSKLAIVTTLILLTVGTLLTFLLEYHNPDTIGHLSFGEKWMASAFQSVTTRTAGYSTFSQAGMHEETRFLNILLMFIGGSPMGTAGGVKTTTIAVLILSIAAYLQGKKDVEVYGRRIRESYLRSAMVVAGTSVLILFTMTVLLSAVMPGVDLADVLYEITSAGATVGLSRGLTPQLNVAGKWIVILTMYLGRIGPLTLGTAVVMRVRNRPGSTTHLGEEDIMIG